MPDGYPPCRRSRFRDAIAPLVTVLVVLLSGSSASLAEAPLSPVDAIGPPIGVIGETTHGRGRFILSYRFQRQSFSGLMEGTNRLSGTLQGFRVRPTSMDQDTHLFEALWSPFADLTLSVMLPYLHKVMSQVDQNSGQSYQTTSGGFGDLRVLALHQVFADRNTRVHLKFGLSFPTGSTTQSQVTPVSGGDLKRLPYAMQLGSGTVDLSPGATYNGAWYFLYWGAQADGVLRAGTNAEDYTLGNAYAVTGWLGGRLSDWFNASVRIDWNQWFNPEGQDALMAPVLSPAADAQLQAGQRLDVLVGIDLLLGGALKGTRLSIEGGCPVYQDLKGPQLRTGWLLNAGLQYAF